MIYIYIYIYIHMTYKRRLAAFTQTSAEEGFGGLSEA